MRRSWEWFTEKAKSKYAERWLALLSFSEASFFPIPTDVLLIAILSAKAGRWVRYAFITSVTSVVGALFGYAVGVFVFEPVAKPIISFYALTEEFAHVGSLYETGTFWIVLTAAFTPIPFKVFTIAGGFFGVALIPFTLASIIGRSMRFFAVAWVSHRFGPRVAELCITYFNQITIVASIILLIALAVMFDLPELIW